MVHLVLTVGASGITCVILAVGWLLGLEPFLGLYGVYSLGARSLTSRTGVLIDFWQLCKRIVCSDACLTAASKLRRRLQSLNPASQTANTKLLTSQKTGVPDCGGIDIGSPYPKKGPTLKKAQPHPGNKSSTGFAVLSCRASTSTPKLYGRGLCGPSLRQ